jgi:hypothetical protein
MNDTKDISILFEGSYLDVTYKVVDNSFDWLQKERLTVSVISISYKGIEVNLDYWPVRKIIDIEAVIMSRLKEERYERNSKVDDSK